MRRVLAGMGLGLALAAAGGPAGATTVTFDNGVLQTFSNQLLSGIYTEAGMQFDIYGAAPQLVDYGAGTLSLRIELNNDIIIHRVGGGVFSFDSFLFSGGGDTVMGGYHGNFVSGGLNNHAGADVAIGLGGLGGTIYPVVSNPDWGDIDTIDWCGYCISGFAPGNFIDDFTFSVPTGVPEPTAWALMIAGFGGLGAVMRARRRVGLAAN